MLTHDQDGFRRAGRPHRIVSGALHYFRVHPDLWEDRLTRLRAMGADTVDTYVPWNFHETAPGKADFTGWRDLGRFLRIAQDLGFDAIVRPGPYICAEWDFGGLPARLLALDGLHLRCSDPRFLAEVDGWFDQLVPELLPLLAGRGGPVVAVQIENEYGSYGDDVRYRTHVERALVERGVDCLLFTADGAEDAMLQGGTVPGRLATATFGARPTERLDTLRRYQRTGPLAAMEYWIGWFDHWGDDHHVRAVEDAAGSLDELLASGASVNLYMAHGGTNFGFWAGANHTGSRPGEPGYQPTVTSYDYDAPIGEAGELTPKFHAFREVIGRYLPLPDLPLPAPRPRLAPGTAVPAGTAGLLPAVDRLTEGSGGPVLRPAPEPMEKLGQSHGMIHYRTSVTGPRPAMPVRIDGLGDRAYVFADGEPLGILDRNAPDEGLDLAVGADGVVLDILVRAQGRVNYGPLLDDRKGIWRGVRHGHQHLFEWEIRPLPLTDLTPLDWSPAGAPPAAADRPAFHRFTHDIPAPADGFLDLSGWSTGLVWLNGFLLGHYDTPRGPQRTLYAPGPLWQTGRNELVVLELERPGPALPVRDRPDLGRPKVVTLQ
ncbi:beta-galactosidase family protein [Streptomyces sp. WAC06614]|uniref:glycoside hydrolase family 35 protein n=1 Tax=Streptomyces sp. WAC06614 TaxID=2487416 RepID=UPI000F7B46E3|nr:beta-galactosidase family protein [Streptomyces sp. WAC06614]RSS78832.1 beta-galactosidase [Streptomyces sp. WAC06614]